MQAPESSLSLYKTFSLPPSEETGAQDESRNPASKVWVFCTWLAFPLPPPIGVLGRASHAASVEM